MELFFRLGLWERLWELLLGERGDDLMLPLREWVRIRMVFFFG